MKKEPLVSSEWFWFLVKYLLCT